VPHTLKEKFIDGTRFGDTAETVTLEQRGIYEWVVADAVAEPVVQASLEYVEGEDVGSRIDSVGAQMQDLQVTAELGAAVISTEQIMIGGEDLADSLALIPKSSTYAIRTNTTANKDGGPTSGTTELRIFTFNAGPVTAGRLYEIGVKGIGAGTVAGDWFWTRLRYTLDGSDPTTSSPLIIGSPELCTMSPGPSIRANIKAAALFACPSDGELRIAFTLNRHAGTGTIAAMVTPLGAGFAIWCNDRGVNVDSSTALQQTAYTDGSGSDNAPIITRALAWQATRHDNFPGWATFSGTAISANDNAAYQGWRPSYGPATAANDRGDFSILHFDYTDIMAKLASATSIDSVLLTFTVGGRIADDGLDVNILSHTYTTIPPSLAGNLVGEIAAGRIFLGLGAKGNAAPGATYTLELGSTFGGQLKAGTRRGVGIYGNGVGAAGRGFIYGYPNAARPKLTIKFKSP
jgi:hypothetical protein